MSFLGSLFDAATGFSGSFLGQYFNKKNMRDQAKLQYEYAERYAKNTPSWNIEGLRSAGLNPMLAVSNGVNFGANIPSLSNHSPDAKVNTKFTEAIGRMNDRAVNQQNADSNTETADAQTMTAQANMLKAKSDANLKQAETLKVLQESQRANQSKFSSPIVRDIMGIKDDIVDQSKDIVKEASTYLLNAPQRNLPKATSTQTKHAPVREKEVDRYLDSMWKTRKKIDGKPVYRKRGDVGGVMHMYR